MWISKAQSWFLLFSPTLCFQPPTLETEFISCRRWPLWKWRRPDISDMLWWFSPPSLWQTNSLTVSVVIYLMEMDKHWSQSSDQIMIKKKTLLHYPDAYRECTCPYNVPKTWRKCPTFQIHSDSENTVISRGEKVGYLCTCKHSQCPRHRPLGHTRPRNIILDLVKCLTILATWHASAFHWVVLYNFMLCNQNQNQNHRTLF